MIIWKETEVKSVYCLEPISKDIIEDYERTEGIKLPKSYKESILIQNGGEIKFNAFPTKQPTSWASDHLHISHIFGLGQSDNSISRSGYYIKEWELPVGIILFSGTGHTWIAFDYRQTKENPPIIYIDTEISIILKIANDFDTFLQGLYVETYEDIEYEIIEIDSSRENIEMVFSNLNSFSTTDVMNLIPYVSYNPDQKFVFTQFLLGIKHPDEGIRESIATRVFFIVQNQNITELSLLRELIDIISKDDSDNVRQYSDYIINLLSKE
jgi:cupin superfamily acireductone dioxygenase involved in methionine salvage